MNKDRIFTWDFKSIYETRDFAVTGLFGIRNGVALNIGGILAFRTYNFRVLLNIDYSLTFNDYNDRASVLTIGIMRAEKKWYDVF